MTSLHRPRFLALLVALAASLLSSTFVAARVVELNQDWTFQKTETTGIESPEFSDTDWRHLDLPHDWSVEDLPADPAKAVGPHDRTTPGGADVGYLRGGTGWYRHRFTLGYEDAGRIVSVVFDGIQQYSDVWINGQHVGSQAHGYIPFSCDLTPHLRPAGQPNVLVVRAVNPDQNSRWYSGSGIYRQVSLQIAEAVHIPTWGVRLETTALAKDSATLNVETKVVNDGKTEAISSSDLELVAPNGTTTHFPLGSITLPAGGTGTIATSITVPAPKLWSPATPQLYKARIHLLNQGKPTDMHEEVFGIRMITVSATDGLRINGQQVLLKGGCLHHDNGLLGAAAFPDAEYRRVATMKANGFNAIRTSHNPPSTAFLESCDRLGVLVIDEFVDMWKVSKRPNDYSKHFSQDWKHDLTNFLLRDRNHPSVIIWSIGNEIPERADESGLAIARDLIAATKELDRSRPVTQAICAFWDHADWTWERSAPAFALLDIGGYNYQSDKYSADHASYPDRVMVSTESYPNKALEYWRPVAAYPYVIGDFVWAGMDYIGESGIGHTSYLQGDEKDPFLKSWPWWNSWTGDIDLIGNKKPQSFYRDVVWDRSPIELAVHAPVPVGAHEQVHYWGWPDEYQSWNWSGHEGVPLRVTVYSKSKRVRLLLNNTLVGEADTTQGEGITATFDVPYAPGVLKAVTLGDATPVSSKELRTSGLPAAIALASTTYTLKADRSELLYIPIEIVDSLGKIVPDAQSRISIVLQGEAQLIAFGNGGPTISRSLQGTTADAFRGRALAILRSTGKPGPVTITLSSSSLRPASLRVDAR